MRRSWTRLRRGLLAAACVASLGFGATQALASPGGAWLRTCPWNPNGPSIDDDCNWACTQQGYDFGYCENGQCVCTDLS